MRLLFVVLVLFVSLFANENISNLNDNNQSSKAIVDTYKLPNVLYLSYEEFPSRVIKGEIFSLKIKALSTVKKFTDITYELSALKGLKLLSYFPLREEVGMYYYETFYFLVTEDKAELPSITGTLLDYEETVYKKDILKSKELNVVDLHPKDNFANIVAKSFELIEYKTTSYDTQKNIVVFVATAEQCDIASFKLQNVFKQGIESLVESYFDSKITYYAIIDKKIQNFSFSYFDSGKNKFIDINIPIIVDDDSVTTQTDLKPKDQSKEQLKMVIAASVAVFGFLIILWRKKYIYLVFIIFPLIYIISIAVPSEDICIKQGSNIMILPVNNGTIFEVTPSRYYLPKEGSIKNFTKVKLKNSKIGWVKNEDICSY